MKKYIRPIMIVLAVLLMISACQSGSRLESGYANEARTYFESLNLETPEDTVRTFAQAFQREDFMTVYLVLDLEAQKQQRMDFARIYSWQHLIGETTANGLMSDGFYKELTQSTVDAWYIFDQIMLYAAEEDDLLIDLRGDLLILRSEEAETPDGRKAVDVIVDVDGVSGEVVFRVVADRDNRWRVYLVSAPGDGVDSWPSIELNVNP